MVDRKPELGPGILPRETFTRLANESGMDERVDAGKATIVRLKKAAARGVLPESLRRKPHLPQK